MMTSPPLLPAKVLSMFLDAEDREALLGDLDEEYRIRASVSPEAASRWYWGQALCSCLPLLRRRSRRDRWLSTGAIAIGGYLVVGAINAAASWLIEQWTGGRLSTIPAGIVALLAIAIGAQGASRLRRASGRMLGYIVAMVAVVLLLVPVDASPLWFQVLFVILGPLAARLGATVAVSKGGL